MQLMFIIVDGVKRRSPSPAPATRTVIVEDNGRQIVEMDFDPPDGEDESDSLWLKNALDQTVDAYFDVIANESEVEEVH